MAPRADTALKPAGDPQAWVKAFADAPADQRLCAAFAGLVADTTARLCQQAPLRLDSGFDAALMSGLSARLAPVAAPALCVELASARDRGELQGGTPEARFDAFVFGLAAGRYAARLWSAYPTMIETVAAMAAQYAGFINELMIRLGQDWEALNASFCHGQGKLSALTDIAFCGDAHGGGRMVTRLSARSDRGIIDIYYKPRPIAAEAAFHGLLARLAQALGDVHSAPPLIVRDGYGWQGSVAYSPCAHREAVTAYYRRFGHLAATCHLLLARDLHAGNIVADAAHPVLIDAEGVMPPRFGFHPPAEAMARGHLAQSLLLPMAQTIGQGWRDDSAVSGIAGTAGPLQRGWRAEGTDQMSPVWRPVPARPAANRPCLEGAAIDPLNYEAAFTEGFAEAFRAIGRLSKTLRGEHSPLRAFAGVSQRVALRNTGAYRHLLARSYAARYWAEPGTRAALLDGLAKDQSGAGVIPRIAPHERADLLDGDIPIFRTVCDRPGVMDGRGETVELPVMETGFSRVLKHLQTNFTEAALAHQRAVIAASFTERRRVQQG